MIWADLMDEPDRPIRADDPVDDRVGSALRSGSRPACDPVAVVRVDEGQERLLGAGERARFDAEDAARLVGPPHEPGAELHLPAPDMGGPLRLVEVELAQAERFEEAIALSFEAFEAFEDGFVGSQAAARLTCYMDHAPSVARARMGDHYLKVRCAPTSAEGADPGGTYSPALRVDPWRRCLVVTSTRLRSSAAGCSTRAMSRVVMNRPVRTGTPVRVTSRTSTTPRAVTTSIRRPARVATISKVWTPWPVSTTASTRSPFMAR